MGSLGHARSARALRAAHHSLCDPAEQEPSNAVSSLGRHDDQVGGASLGEIDDGARRGSDPERSPAAYPPPTEICGQPRETALSGALLMLPKLVEIDRGADHRRVCRRFDDVDDLEASLQGAGQIDREPQCRERWLREVDRD